MESFPKQYLPDAKIIFLAAFWSWQFSSNAFEKSLDIFLAEQSQKDGKVYILEQEPLLKIKPSRAIRFKALGLEPGVDLNLAYQQANTNLRHVAARHLGVVTQNFEDSEFFAKAPYALGTLIYADEHHLNEVGVQLYAAVAKNTFSKIF